MSLEIKQYDFKNLEQLKETYARCFGTAPKTEYFKWKYLDNPDGQAIAYVAVAEDQKIAAFYGMIPELYHYDGKEKVIYQSMDTMTHPNFQRRGLFTTLAEKCYHHIIENEGSLHAIGFPGPTSYGGFIHKLGWNTLIEINYLFLNKTLFQLRNLNRKKSSITFEVLPRFNDEFTAFTKKNTTSNQHFAKSINAENINWRTVDKPNSSTILTKISEAGNTLGYGIFEIDNKLNAVFIKYLHTISGQEATLVHPLCSYLFKTYKTASIYTFMSQPKNLINQLKKVGFLTNPFNKGFFSYRTPIIVFSDQESPSSEFYESAHWNIQPILRDY